MDCAAFELYVQFYFLDSSNYKPRRKNAHNLCHNLFYGFKSQLKLFDTAIHLHCPFQRPQGYPKYLVSPSFPELV